MKIRIILILLFISSSIFAQDIQWASKVIAVSSEDVDKSDSTFYKAKWVLGEPQDFSKTVLQWQMWKPKIEKNGGSEWIKVGFEKPLVLKKITIHLVNYQSLNFEIIGYDSLNNEKLKESIYSDARSLLNIFTKDNTSNIKYLTLKISNDTLGVNYLIDAIGVSDYYNPEIKQKPLINRVIVNHRFILAKDIPEKIEIEKLNKNINSKFREVAPIISSEEKTMYFTREGYSGNVGISRGQDIWFTEKNEKNEWGKPKNIGKPLNTESHNAASGISFVGNKLFLINEYNSDGTYLQGLSYSDKTENGWTFPKKVIIDDYLNLTVYSEFTFSPNEDVLILSAARHDSYQLIDAQNNLLKQPSKDLYVSFRISENHYSIPRNLGGIINSNNTEATPVLAADSKTLYFSSKAHYEFRDADIYMTKRLDDSWLNWSEPINLGEGINTPKWDGYFSVTASGEYAYICQESKATKEDIYQVKLYDSIKPEPISIIKGVVLDAETKKPLHTEIILKEINGKDKYSVYSNPESGKFTLVFPKNYQYKLIVENQGFTNFEQDIDNSKQENMFRMQLEVLLRK